MNLCNNSTSAQFSESESDDHMGIFTNSIMTYVSKQIKKKIWNTDFTNLPKLYYGKESNNLSMFVKKSKASTITSLNRVPRQKITNILSWDKIKSWFLYDQKFHQLYTKRWVPCSRLHIQINLFHTLIS